MASAGLRSVGPTPRAYPCRAERTPLIYDIRSNQGRREPTGSFVALVSPSSPAGTRASALSLSRLLGCRHPCAQPAAQGQGLRGQSLVVQMPARHIGIPGLEKSFQLLRQLAVARPLPELMFGAVGFPGPAGPSLPHVADTRGAACWGCMRFLPGIVCEGLGCDSSCRIRAAAVQNGSVSRFQDSKRGNLDVTAGAGPGQH